MKRKQFEKARRREKQNRKDIRRQRLENRKRRIERRLQNGWPANPFKPAFQPGNIRYEVAERTQGLACGGIGLVHIAANDPRSPCGRLRTAPTATLPTATQANRDVEQPTAKERKRPLPKTAWELRELIRPLPVRRQPAPDRPCRTRHPFDPALVEYVWANRYVLVSHLQRRFPQWLPSYRTAQRHARRLIQQKLIAPAPVRSTGPNFPTVLTATGRGVKLVEETYAAHGLDWEGPLTEERKAKGLALDTIHHELLLSEFDVGLHLTVDARDDLTLLVRERRYFRSDRQLTYPERGRTRRLVPDAGFLVAVRDSHERRLLPLHLLEMENGVHSVAKIRDKLAAYTRWAETEAEEYLPQLAGQYGQHEHALRFRLLVVCHDKYGTVSDERRLLDWLSACLELPRRMRQAIWFTTATTLQQHQHDQAPLAGGIWYRARDLAKHLPEYGRQKNEWGTIPAASLYAHQRQFVREVLPQLPQHPLFPNLNTP